MRKRSLAAQAKHARFGSGHKQTVYTDDVLRAIKILRDERKHSWKEVAAWLTKHGTKTTSRAVEQQYNKLQRQANVTK